MKIQGKYIRIAWVSFIVLTIVLLLAAVARRKNSQIKELNVAIKKSDDLENMVSEAHVKDLVTKAFGSNLINTQIEDIDIGRIEQAIELDPAITKADVYLDAKNRLQINIKQREPILRIRDNNGADYYLDLKAKKFPWSKEFTPRVLVATGNIPPYQEDFQQKERSTLKDLVILTHFIQENEFWNTFIQQIYVTDKSEFVLVPLVGSHKILFGNAEDIESKFQKLETFYKEALPYKGWNEYDVVDVRFKGQVIGRKL